MKPNQQEFEFDVFVSYRWAEPYQSWVRYDLVPALEAAGLKVCLDVSDFVPGQDLILEMTRAVQSSRRALCILSEDYFSGNRMVHFESLMARRFDPGGVESHLIPFVLRLTELPEWLRGLIPINWIDANGRVQEWQKLLQVLGAPYDSSPPRAPIPTTTPRLSSPVFVHDYNLPHTFVARASELTKLNELLVGSDGEATRPSVIAVTAIGGVGKSCLCRAILERPEIAAKFSRIVWFSFYEARTEAEDYFLREVLTNGYQWEDRENSQGANDTKRLRRALAGALNREHTLLVLDGLEVIQFSDDPESPKFGGIKPIWSEVDKLLRHMLNSPSSVCLVTSRVPLRAIETRRGYHEVSLDLFEPEDGAALLLSLGVKGNSDHLEACAEKLGGHALSLVAAGRFMSRRQIPADQLADLVGDPDLFQRTAEGEKVKRICEWYRSELNAEQEYFLTRLSLHSRSITAANFPVVIPRYKGTESDQETEEQIIQPLVERGLVDRLESSNAATRFSVHPLMKLAYSTWLEPEARKRAHEEWARAAAAAPGQFFRVETAWSLEELQPLVDATEQYLAAENWEEAWAIYSGRNLAARLGRLGYIELSLVLARQFEEVSIRDDDWDPYKSVFLFDTLAWLSNRLERTEDNLHYRRKELTAAKAIQLVRIDEVEDIVASSLATSGFVKEAAGIRPKSYGARGVIALAQGHYKRASQLLHAAFEHGHGHDRTVTAQPLAEALYRSNEFKKAAKVLKEALQLAICDGYACCERAILSELTDIALYRNDLPNAQLWWEKLTELRKRLELENSEHSGLLLAQGDIDGALAAADATDQIVPTSVIKRHVAKARVFLRKGNREQAASELGAAKDAQSSSGYAQLKNEIEQLRRELRR